MYILAARYSLIASLAMTAIHYSSRGVVAVEDYIISRVTAGKVAAVEALAARSGFVRPEPEEDVKTLQEMVDIEARRQRVNPALARSLMHVESAGNPLAISPKGAIGVMQIMPANAKRCGYSSPAMLFDEAKNIRCGVQILSEELKTYGNDPVRALQSYNGGGRCIGKCRESIEHSAKVLKALARDVS